MPWPPGKILAKMAAGFAATVLVFAGGCLTPPAFEGLPDRPVIVLAAPGSPLPAARQIYASLGAQFHARFPGDEIRWAFIDENVVRALRGQGLVCQTPRETAKTLTAGSHSAVAWQSLQLLPGEGLAAIAAVDFGDLAVTGGAPLLNSDRDYYTVMDALEPLIRPNQPNVLVCHGNRNRGGSNREFLALANLLTARHPNLIVAFRHGAPGATVALARARVLARQAGTVHFIPFMLVPDDFLVREVMGDTPDSWKNQVGAARVTCAEPLGSNPRILAIYLQHLEQAIQNLEE